MYTKNIIIGSQKKSGSEIKKSDSVAVYIPELSSENQVVSKFQTSLLEPQDYNSYAPVYMPTTVPLKSLQEGCCYRNRNCCLYILLIFIVIMLILLAGVLIFSVIQS